MYDFGIYASDSGIRHCTSLSDGVVMLVIPGRRSEDANLGNGSCIAGHEIF
jgi:hypothetical protein